ncbi:Alpha-1,2-mannosidase [Phytophthora palmivora]|uniref:Alpha-1,2-mannosidase n=1 Tax=Phytophthora palmivora TaxID=4796 RepID=A0A2P4YNA8_9STRA|nr:Alpha-1,2-mannosidase [Phytophthora palmivora]
MTSEMTKRSKLTVAILNTARFNRYAGISKPVHHCYPNLLYHSIFKKIANTTLRHSPGARQESLHESVAKWFGKTAGALLHTAPKPPTNEGGTPIFREVT